jgi:hypothetical protein
VLESVLAEPTDVRRRGAAALDFVRERHDPMRNAIILEAIYDTALQG